MITTFVFRVRNVPSALYKALGGFATNGVNMTKLESYMVNGEFAATQFLVDVEGHPDDANLARALEELRFFCETRDHPRRLSGAWLPAGNWPGRGDLTFAAQVRFGRSNRTRLRG